MMPVSERTTVVWQRIRVVAASALLGSLTACAVTPVALDDKATNEQISRDLQLLTADVPAVVEPITLSDAIARAVKYNREQRLKMMETALQQRQLDLAQFDMLPTLTAEAGYSDRSNILASSSTSVLTGNQSLEPSTSTEQELTNAELVFSWNILDFGLSYVRAQQQADRALIARERERKALHTITEEVRGAYWRALSADRLLRQIGPLMVRVDQALADAATIEQEQVERPLEALTYRRELLDMLRSLQGLRRDLAGAKTELGTLMGLKPGQVFSLAPVVESNMMVPELKVSIEDMEHTALMRRPELMESRYETRISSQEARAALLGVLPGITIDFGRYYDSNDFLVNNNWSEVGAAISWNLFNVFKAPAAMEVAEVQEQVAEQRRLALSMAVLGQAHLARITYEQAVNDFEIAAEYLTVARQITGYVDAAGEAAQIGELQVIREQLNAVLAELRRDVAYASVQNSYGRVFASMGVDPLPDTVASDDLDTLSQAIAVRLQAWSDAEPSLFAVYVESGAEESLVVGAAEGVSGEEAVVAEVDIGEAVAAGQAAVSAEVVEASAASTDTALVDDQAVAEAPAVEPELASEAMAGSDALDDESVSAMSGAALLEYRIAATEAWASAEERPFTVQLGTARGSQAEVERFLRISRANGLIDRVFVYRSDDEALPHWGLIYGAFDSLTDARVASENLPRKMRRYGPYVRNVSAIAREIEQGGGDGAL
jgi:outer membrane protein TolC